MKNLIHPFHILILGIISGPMALDMKATDTESIDCLIQKDYEWQYYMKYGYYRGPITIRLPQYTIVDSYNPEYPYEFKCLGYHYWVQDDPRNGEATNYKGYVEENESIALLREEDGIVYLSLDNYHVPDSEILHNYWGINWNGLSIYDRETEFVKPYLSSANEEVILYNYNAKIGDCYRSIIFGSLICDVIVTNVSDIDVSTDASSSICIKQIDVIPDYAAKKVELYSNDILTENYTIKYAAGLGNISRGDYINLFTEPYVYPDNGYHAEYVLNNIYRKDGAIYFQGKDFQGLSGIKNISLVNNDSHIFDLYGRTVTNPLPGSVYIRSGKKYIGK